MTTATFSLIQAGLSVHGDVACDHGISCLGLVGGDLRSTHGLVHVGAEGLIRGTVEGEHVLVDGTIEGDVAARVSLRINGRVKGRIVYAGTIRLGPNAALEGTIARVSSLGYDAINVAAAPIESGAAPAVEPQKA
ncbi:Polymer-forming protein [Cupriavidus sp. YR651]|uniref:bactofilin family protein n=1 Tax=Cupriavidus sp. YR651 TaxID=1855315 RepID=UPI00088FFA19|nr:polymer-forming cytoskeletal protein [Cupriavidus sp. YR651]SDD58776.1 Polymer-forming protein [Cupriavidus sp. YR651]